MDTYVCVLRSNEVTLDMFVILFFFEQKTAYEMRISDWSSDVCSSDLPVGEFRHRPLQAHQLLVEEAAQPQQFILVAQILRRHDLIVKLRIGLVVETRRQVAHRPVGADRSEEHTSELQ